MLQQPGEVRTPFPVRDGQLTVVTCAACGCRLETLPSDAGTWRHFGALGGRDARGCRPLCVDLIHDALGRAAVAV